MALIKCPECGRHISDKAASCPGCGYPMNFCEHVHEKVQYNRIFNDEILDNQNSTKKIMDSGNMGKPISESRVRDNRTPDEKWLDEHWDELWEKYPYSKSGICKDLLKRGMSYRQILEILDKKFDSPEVKQLFLERKEKRRQRGRPDTKSAMKSERLLSVQGAIPQALDIREASVLDAQ